jgi:hypothetical protein
MNSFRPHHALSYGSAFSSAAVPWFDSSRFDDRPILSVKIRHFITYYGADCTGNYCGSSAEGKNDIIEIRKAFWAYIARFGAEVVELCSAPLLYLVKQLWRPGCARERGAVHPHQLARWEHRRRHCRTRLRLSDLALA